MYGFSSDDARSPLDRLVPEDGLQSAIADLSLQFDKQTLRPSRRQFYSEDALEIFDAPFFTIPQYDAARGCPSPLLAPSSSTYSNPSTTRSNSIAWSEASVSSTSSLPSATLAPYPQSSSSSYQRTNVRLHRQRALWNQCNPSHLKEIQDLVSRMVSTGEQCDILGPEVKQAMVDETAVESSEEDDVEVAFQSFSKSVTGLKYRRAGDDKHSRTCISKEVRLRKHKRRHATSN